MTPEEAVRIAREEFAEHADCYPTQYGAPARWEELSEKFRAGRVAAVLARATTATDPLSVLADSFDARAARWWASYNDPDKRLGRDDPDDDGIAELLRQHRMGSRASEASWAARQARYLRDGRGPYAVGADATTNGDGDA